MQRLSTAPPLERLHLHALGLSFADPFSGQRIRVRSPLPWL